LPRRKSNWSFGQNSLRKNWSSFDPACKCRPDTSLPYFDSRKDPFSVLCRSKCRWIFCDRRNDVFAKSFRRWLKKCSAHRRRLAAKDFRWKDWLCWDQVTDQSRPIWIRSTSRRKCANRGSSSARSKLDPMHLNLSKSAALEERQSKAEDTPELIDSLFCKMNALRSKISRLSKDKRTSSCLKTGQNLASCRACTKQFWTFAGKALLRSNLNLSLLRIQAGNFKRFCLKMSVHFWWFRKSRKKNFRLEKLLTNFNFSFAKF